MIHFLGIGAQKAGTTWLFRHLGRHPGIAFPAGKELHFWNRFPAARPQEYLQRFPSRDPTVRQGEITPAYALLDSDCIDRVRAVNPALRIFFCLRNPIERAWSSALMAVQRAEMQPEEASDAWFIDHFRSAGSLGRGDYLTTIRRWRAAFGTEPLLLLRFEDLVERPVDVLERCVRHVGARPGWFRDAAGADLRERVFAGPDLPIRPALGRELTGLYAAQIDALERELGWDLSAWRSA